MKCNSLLWAIVGSACQMAVSATGDKVVAECHTPGQVALVVNGLASDNSPVLLEALKAAKVTALITVDKAMLVGSDNLALVSGAKGAGHDLGYSVGMADMETLTDDQLAKDLEDAKLRFAELYQVKLTYVMFPPIEAMEKRSAGLAKRTGLTAVSHSLSLGSADTQAKSAIKDHLYDHRSNSYIALLEGNAAGLKDTLRYYGQRMRQTHFRAVSMDVCLRGTGSRGGKSSSNNPVMDSSDEEEKPIKGAKKQTHRKDKNPRIPSYLIAGAHGRKEKEGAGHKKSTLLEKGKKKKRASRQIDPKLIAGFNKRRHGHHHQKKSRSTPVDQAAALLIPAADQVTSDAQKMAAMQGKDFGWPTPNYIELKDDAPATDATSKTNADSNVDKKKDGNANQSRVKGQRISSKQQTSH